MNLYYLYNPEPRWCEQYYSCVVCAESESIARLIHPDKTRSNYPVPAGSQPWGEDWCDSPDKVAVKLIGLAAEDMPANTVLIENSFFR